MSSASRKWNRDELILALDLYMRVTSSARSTDPEVVELSELLRTSFGHADQSASSRSRHSVHMKLQNFLRFDPSYNGEAMRRGGRDEAEVWNDFANRPAELRKLALTIRAHLAAHDETSIGVEEDVQAIEGAVLVRQHRFRERATGLVAEKKARAIAASGALKCEVCGFDFSVRYGSAGAGFMECHHTKPLSSLMPGSVTKLQDLALVCSNCHRMLHRGRPWPSMTELRALLRSG